MTALAPSTARGRATFTRTLGRHGWLVLAIAAAALAIMLRFLLPTNEDVSWLLELAGRTLSGARPYVDYFEVNPPASIGLYLAPTMLARALALRPETMTDAMVFLAAAVSVALSAGMLGRAGLLSAAGGRTMLASVVFALLVLPSYTFAEREHIAVLAALPGLAVSAMRLAGHRPGRRDIIVAGLGDAIVVIIKPMLVLGLVGPVAILALMVGWRVVITAAELWIGACVAAAYGAAVLLFMPVFAQTMLPLAMTIYVPRRLPWPWLLLLLARSGWPGGPLSLLLLARTGRIGPIATILGSASVGFAGAFLLQGKGFPYHLYPALSLGLMATAFGLLHDRPWAPRTASQTVPPVALLAVSLVVCAALGFTHASDYRDPFTIAPDIAPTIATLGPHPRLLTVSPIFCLGQPFVRRLGGQWAGSAPSLWVSGDVEDLAAGEAPTPSQAAAVRFEQGIFARDIVHQQPDGILVDGQHWQDWIVRSPALTAAMAAYRPLDRSFGAVTLWVRRTRAPAGTP